MIKNKREAKYYLEKLRNDIALNKVGRKETIEVVTDVLDWLNDVHKKESIELSKVNEDNNVAKIIDVYESFAKDRKLPKVVQWTGTRKLKVKTLCNKFSYEELITCLETLAGNEWLNEKVTEGWYNAEWIFTDKRIIETLEGKYSKNKTKFNTPKESIKKPFKIVI